MPPPGVPGPFSLEEADRLERVLAEAGLEDARVEEFPVATTAESFDQWWARTTALAGPLARVLESMPEDAAETLKGRAREAAAPYETADGLVFPGVTLVGSARHPSTS
jgi:hypothetical protein